MARYEPSDLTGVLAPVNPELEKIKEAILDTLSRNGDTPNSMETNLDMNSNRVLNLVDAVNDKEPATLGQVKALIEKLIGGSFDQTDLTPEEIEEIIQGVTDDVLNSQLVTDLQAEIQALELEDLNLRTDVNQISLDLNNEIVRVNGIFGELDDIDTAILNETTQRTSADEALATSITGLGSQFNGLNAQLLIEQQTRATADSAIVQTIQTLQTFSAKIFVQDTAPTIAVAPDNAVAGDLWYDSDDNNHPYTLLDINGTLTWTSIRDGQFTILQSQVQTEQTARIDGDTALAQSITNLTSTVTTNQSLALAAVQTESTARATADSALSQDITNLTSAVNTNNTNVLAALTAEQTARANADGALASDITTLAATVNTNNSNAFAAIQNESTVRANADSAISSTVNTLTSTVNNNTATIQTTKTVTDGVAAQYMVKTDVNGYVSGYGLYNTGVTSEFVVLADRFAIVTPGINPTVPFAVDANGVFIQTAFIRELNAGKITGQIVNNQIADLTINGVKLSNGAVTADKIFAGSVTADKIEAGAITADKIQAGSITATKLSADAIDGKVITGSLIRTAASGSRVEVQDDGTYLLWGGDSTKNDANAAFYIKKNGSAFFAGDITDGVASSSDYDVNTTTRSLSNNVETTVGSATVTTISGKPVSIQGIANGTTFGAFGSGQQYTTTIRVKRNGTTIATKVLNGPYSDYEIVRFFIDNPGAGTFTYTLTVQAQAVDGDFPANPTLNVKYTALQTVQLKR